MEKIFDEKFLSAEQRREIDENGITVLRQNPVVMRNLERLRDRVDYLLKTEGDRAGWEGKEEFYAPGKAFEVGCNRLGNLIEKDPVFVSLITIPELLAAAGYMIGSEFKVGSVDMREPLKSNYGRQQIHIDWFPREKETDPVAGLVAMVFLDDSRVENGATRVIPGTHKKLGWPDEHLDAFTVHPDIEKRMEANAGDIVVMSLSLFHSSADNLTGARRRAIFVDIRRRELPQLLNLKKYLSIQTWNRLTPMERYLLGVRDEDPTQSEKSIGPNERYRQRFGDSRPNLEKAVQEGKISSRGN